MIGLIKRKPANRQPFGTDGDSDSNGRACASAKAVAWRNCIGAIASVVHSLGKIIELKVAGGRTPLGRL
jgi:hypothetical protein